MVPEHLRALVVILVLATMSFALAGRLAVGQDNAFSRRRNTWYAVTSIAFLAHDFWVFLLCVGVLLFLVARHESNPLAFFYFVLFAVPPIREKVHGLGLFNHLFTIDYVRLLCLAVLMPAFISLMPRPKQGGGNTALADKLLLAYLVLQLALTLVASTATNALRIGVFYAALDIFLPYYVASRTLRTLDDFRHALSGFVCAALVLAAIALFETPKHWLLYASLDTALGSFWALGNYLERADAGLRAQASTGQPICLGYLLAVGLGLLAFLKPRVSRPQYWWLAFLLLSAGLAASLSRGPWIGAAVIGFVFVLTSRSLSRATLKAISSVGLIAAALFLSPLGADIADYLPFLGSVESENVVYRQRLLEISLYVMLQNPFFGAFDYVYAPEMQELMQHSQGIIDIVNTYVGIGLSSGFVGLGLFVAFFFVILLRLFVAMKRLPSGAEEAHLLARTLLSTMIGVLVIIFTVSSISFIPVVYWSLAGVCMAYTRCFDGLVASTVAGMSPSSRIAGVARHSPVTR